MQHHKEFYPHIKRLFYTEGCGRCGKNQEIIKKGEEPYDIAMFAVHELQENGWQIIDGELICSACVN